MTTWPTPRTPPIIIEPPMWVRRYTAADWTDLSAWNAACSDWFNAHPDADWFKWLMTPQPVGDGRIATLDEWPFDPY